MPSVDLGSGRIAVQVSSGMLSVHTCVLLDDSSITCWGNNVYGQLGMQDTVHRGGSPGSMGNNLPLVDFGSGFTPATLNRMNTDRSCAISADATRSLAHVCALHDTLGEVFWCWLVSGAGIWGHDRQADQPCEQLA
eukprot:2141167-Amphidinium_carterae.1